MRVQEGERLSGKTMRVAKLVKICSPRPCVVSRVSLSLSLSVSTTTSRRGWVSCSTPGGRGRLVCIFANINASACTTTTTTTTTITNTTTCAQVKRGGGEKKGRKKKGEKILSLVDTARRGLDEGRERRSGKEKGKGRRKRARVKRKQTPAAAEASTMGASA